MHGTFNGVQLRRITSRKIGSSPTGSKLEGFRVLDRLPELEARLNLNAPALLILSDEIIEGRIVHFSADLTFGYEIPSSQRKVDLQIQQLIRVLGGHNAGGVIGSCGH